MHPWCNHSLWKTLIWNKKTFKNQRKSANNVAPLIRPFYLGKPILISSPSETDLEIKVLKLTLMLLRFTNNLWLHILVTFGNYLCSNYFFETIMVARDGRHIMHLRAQNLYHFSNVGHAREVTALIFYHQFPKHYFIINSLNLQIFCAKKNESSNQEDVFYILYLPFFALAN